MTRQSLSSFRLLIASLCLLLVVSANQNFLTNEESKLGLSGRNRILSTTHGHAEKHVDADDHTHAVELHACEGTELDLYGDAVLHATNVDNTKRFLVTNEELTTCEEIEALTCKPGASFCRVWEANSNQKIDLKYNQFKNGKAHFYALADDKKYVMSLTIKLHPEGHQIPHDSHKHHSGHKEEHVHDDAAYHALELHECTGTTLELPEGENALFDAVPVRNAKRFMVTDIELETCEDISKLNCRPGNKLCHIWNAHDNEMVVLQKDLFRNKEAYFYVEAENAHAAAAVNIKTVPATQDAHGNWHAVGEHEEHNTGHRNGSHTEKHIDVDGHMHAIELKACTGTTIELHGDANVIAHNVFNGKRYMVSSVEMQTCEQIAAFQCLKGAAYCHVWDAKSNDTVPLKFNMFAAGEAYFYADPIDHNQEVSVNLKVVPEGDQHGHVPRGTAVEEILQEIDGHTHAHELHECTAVLLRFKKSAVLDIEAVDNTKSYLITDVPLDTCAEILAWKCHNDAGFCYATDAEAAGHKQDIMLDAKNFPHGEAFLYVKPIDPKFATEVNTRLMNPEDVPKGVILTFPWPTDHRHYLMVYAVLTVLFITLTLSYCYRRYMARYKRAMFNPPFWCPGCLFPLYDAETHETFITAQTTRQENMELSSSMMRQVDV